MNILDPVRNFVRVTTAQLYDDTATSIELSSGEASLLPNPITEGEFNLVWFNSSDYRNPTDDPNVEIVRVIAVDTGTDIITVVRGQEDTSASIKNIGGKTYSMILAFTRKMREDIEKGLVKSFSLSFEVADWQVSGDNYYIDVVHNLDSVNPTVEVRENDKIVFVYDISNVDENTTRIIVPSQPDLRFIGDVSIVKV